MPTIPEALATAIQHHQRGRLQTAAQIYQQILAAEPNQADALHLLGVIAHQSGKHEVAVQHIQRAITLQGSTAFFHHNLGEAYRALGNLPEAVACYRRALELQPDYAGTHNNLGNALKQQGKLDEAHACYRRALELKPDYAEAHYNLGNVLREQGKPDEAAACYRRALELKPNYAEAHSNLGNTLQQQGKLDEAVACLQRALELSPDFAEAHSNLGIAFKEQGKFEEALACWRRALELRPDFAEAHSNLGGALEELGDLKGAEDSFRAALRHNSRFAAVHYKLAELLGGKLADEDLAAQRRLLEPGSASGAQMKLTDVHRLLLHFGLGHVLDARGEYAEAAEHLERGNSLQRSEQRKRGQDYDPKEHELFVTRMIEVCTPDFFQRVRDFDLQSELPVFVVGLPRSGTTLIEQILASHSQVFGAGETQLASDSMAALGGQTVRQADHDHEYMVPDMAPKPDPAIEGLCQLDRDTAHRLAARHLEKLRQLSRTAFRVVDKMPDNYLHLGLLATLFPRAKFIHCRRDLRDIAVSCWMTLFRDVPWSTDQEHIVSRFRAYQRLMRHWRTILPVPLMEVDYEETVADLEGVARRLVAWCGLEWESKCLEFHQTKRPVKTASAVHVRQPIYRTSVGRWKHYEHVLGPLFARLEADGSE